MELRSCGTKGHQDQINGSKGAMWGWGVSCTPDSLISLPGPSSGFIFFVIFFSFFLYGFWTTLRCAKESPLEVLGGPDVVPCIKHWDSHVQVP